MFMNIFRALSSHCLSLLNGAVGIFKSVTRSVLRPFKPYVHRIVRTVFADQHGMLERSSVEQKNLLRQVAKNQKADDAMAQEMREIRTLVDGLAKTAQKDQKNTLSSLENLREELPGIIAKLLVESPTVSRLDQLKENLASEHDEHRTELEALKNELDARVRNNERVVLEKLAELAGKLETQRERELTARLQEMEKRYEIDKKASVEKAVAETSDAKDKEFAEKIEKETKEYFYEQTKKVFPSIVTGTFCYEKRQEKPFSLIVGCAYSGTSIMQTVLGQHPDIYSLHTNVISGRDEPVRESALFDPHRNNRISDRDIIRKLDDIVVKANGHMTVLEKTPTNLFHLGRINQFIPNSKYICMVRDGRDVIGAYLALEGVTEERALFRAAHWLACIDHMEKYMNIAKNMKMVRLGDFTADPHATVHGILDFINLDHSPEIVDYMLRYHERVKSDMPVPRERVITGVEQEGKRIQKIFSARDTQTKQPLYKDTSRWRTDIPVEFWPLMYEKIGPTLERLGYVENAGQSLKEELERWNTERDAARELERQLDEKRRIYGFSADKVA
ncbi:MAG TPA: hypothetical protein DEB39_14060 [Planctomycetaceae bacterium]|nr:hypothetical protein [Planctomycetaceae bacterium]